MATKLVHLYECAIGRWVLISYSVAIYCLTKLVEWRCYSNTFYINCRAFFFLAERIVTEFRKFLYVNETYVLLGIEFMRLISIVFGWPSVLIMFLLNLQRVGEIYYNWIPSEESLNTSSVTFISWKRKPCRKQFRSRYVSKDIILWLNNSLTCSTTQASTQHWHKILKLHKITYWPHQIKM
jgi:hypothetical protein